MTASERIREAREEDLAWRYKELCYRMIECAMTPDHPTTRANRARWTREFRQVEAACDRRGMLEPRHAV